MARTILSQWLAGCLGFLVFFIASSSSAAGSLTGPTPVGYESQYRLAQAAKKSAEAVKKLLPTAMRMAPGIGKAEWLDIAGRFEKRAAMLGHNASFAKKIEYSLGANAAQLKLVAKIIRESVNAKPPKANPSKRKYRWIHVAYVAKAKKNQYIKDVRKRFDEMGRKATADGTHPGNQGNSVRTDGGTVIWTFHSNKAPWLTKMEVEARKVAKAHGGRAL